MKDLSLYAKKLKFLHKYPIINKFLFSYLKSRNPLSLLDIDFHTKYKNSYALLSEKNDTKFKKIMSRLECYIGTGLIGPNKYWEYPWVLANLELKTGISILDVGCGKSPIQYLLSDLGCKVYGIDPYENTQWHGINRKLATLFNCKIEYRREGGDSISYPDNTFDRVCCISVIEHCDLDVKKKIMNEMMRVLKPKGICVITVDYSIPRSEKIDLLNVNVSNLVNSTDTKLAGNRCPELFPGEAGFNYIALIENEDIDISSYYNTLGTSIGLTFQKNK